MQSNNYFMLTQSAAITLPLYHTYPPQQNFNQICNMQQSMGHRKIYINKDFGKKPVAKVLVNPNFKHHVHINPKFQNKTVYINPSLLQTTSQSMVTSANASSVISNVTKVSPANPPKSTVMTRKQICVSPSSKSKYKLNNMIQNVQKQRISKYKLDNRSATSKNKRNTVYTKYKIVRGKQSPSNERVKTRKMIKDTNIQNKFKIDHRKRKSFSPRKYDSSIIKSKYKLIRKSLVLNLDPKGKIIKQKVLKINGNVFKMSANRDVLNMVHKNPNKFINLKKICVYGQVYVKKDENKFVRSKVATSEKMRTNGANRNLMKVNKRVLKKDNMPCLVYRRFGRCLRQLRGACFKQHNPDQISICARFLQGACVKKDCLLSHKVSPEKMPTCKYFLEGRCNSDDCSYLHVKLSKNADICKDFLYGYCKNGVNCTNRHQFLCPYYEKTGKCPMKNCKYPHGEVVRQYTDKLLNKIARNGKRAKKVDTLPAPPSSELPVQRYYKDDAKDCVGDQLVDKSLMERPKVGSLPAFIPLDT